MCSSITYTIHQESREEVVCSCDAFGVDFRPRLCIISIMTSLLFLIFFINTELILGANNIECEKIGKDACIFMGKTHDPQWVKFEESTGPKPFPPSTDSWNKSDTTLFVAIASFRDKLCPYTLFNIFTKAEFPNRISVGVVQQNAPDDIDCLDGYCSLIQKSTGDSTHCPHKDQVRMTRVDAKDAKGPTWGRALGSQLLRNEEFCMQTDAHMDMVPYWDTKMMHMWAMTENEYGILSTYVTDAQELPKLNKPDSKGVNGLQEVPHLCMVHFYGNYGLVRNTDTKCARLLPKPKLNNMIWGAGLSFSKCHAEKKVPYDPHTPGIFDGEEFDRALRFWTYGYDVYTPHRVWVVHDYHKSQSDPKHGAWASNQHDETSNPIQSAERLKTIFGYTTDGISDPNEAQRVIRSKYGLGDRRTLDQAIEFSGVDTRSKKMIANKCGNLDWVPFTPHPWGADYIPEFDPISEDPLYKVVDPGSVRFAPVMLDGWEVLNHKYHEEKKKKKETIIQLLEETIESGKQYAHIIPTSPFGETDQRLYYVIILGGLLLTLSCLALMYGRLFHIGKDHRHIASMSESNYVKTV